jgi:hypothetical protein
MIYLLVIIDLFNREVAAQKKYKNIGYNYVV